MMMSYAEAIEFINPAYNPNVDSFFPQPVLNSTAPVADSSVTSSKEGSLTVAPESFSASNITNQPRAVELRRKKPVEVLQCEICNVSCNSISVLENHKMGKKHRKKTGEQNPQALMLDSMTIDKCMEGVEITNVMNIDKDAIPGAALEEMSTATPISCETQTMLERSSKCSDVISKIYIPKHQEFSTSVADNTCNKKDMDHEEIMADIRQPTQLKPANSADLSHLNAASGSCVRLCTVCNIFSNSQAELEKHLAGKTHACKVKHLATWMPSSVTVYPHSESHTLKHATDTTTNIREPVHSDSNNVIFSENGTVISSPNECTVCSIKCSGQEIFQYHLSERKHASKVRMLGSSVQIPSTKDQGATERASKRGKVLQFAYCDVCKTYCNSIEILDAHMLGKKHRKQLQKLGK